MIKLLIGGSPCTNWSIAQTTAKRECEPKGIGWELFKNYVIAKEYFQPDYFLYENNMSADIKIKNRIEKELHQKIQPINSALVSAQTRKRFYVHNIPNVEQPEDRGIILNDILENGENLTCGEKAYCLTATYNGAVPFNTIERKQRSLVAVKVGYIGNEGQGIVFILLMVKVYVCAVIVAVQAVRRAYMPFQLHNTKTLVILLLLIKVYPNLLKNMVMCLKYLIHITVERLMINHQLL